MPHRKGNCPRFGVSIILNDVLRMCLSSICHARLLETSVASSPFLGVLFTIAERTRARKSLQSQHISQEARRCPGRRRTEYAVSTGKCVHAYTTLQLLGEKMECSPVNCFVLRTCVVAAKHEFWSVLMIFRFAPKYSSMNHELD